MNDDKGHPAVPSREQIIEFMRASATPVGGREIARAFGIKGGGRIALKKILRELAEAGTIEHPRRRPKVTPGRLPDMAVIEVTGTDSDGELLARPVVWTSNLASPPIFIASDRHGTPALARGDRVLARLRRTAEGGYEALPIRRVGGEPKRLVGIFEAGGRLRPADRRVKSDYRILGPDAHGAQPGELVLAEALHTNRPGHLQARVVERLGDFDNPRAIGLISLYERDIPIEFPPEAIAQADAAQPATLGARTDLRQLSLVTIDGVDARDFDDAVWAAPDEGSDNPGGWRIIVAIADVGHYVRPDDALDREARRRGNSVYLPDRAIAMLPEALSNGWCSLKPGEDRPCLAVEMHIDSSGTKRRHRFMRALIRSAARLTYDQAQAARDGAPDTTTAPLLETVITPLYGAFAALLTARKKRGTLDLDLPERQVVLDQNGKVAAIQSRPRHDSHRLIEEFMIAANVAAAEALEERRQPCMYRVHDAPDPAKIEALDGFLDSIGLPLARGQSMRPAVFQRLLARAAETPYAAMVNELVLRSQSQALYSPTNLGHFGLALGHYCHFTSPIRRYADLLVHRALITGFGFGEGGLPRDAAAGFESTAEHISLTERRAAAAERDAVDRFTATFLAGKVGTIFRGTIAGVTRFGLFVRLDESGADGLVPISTLPTDYYQHDEARHALIGKRWGRRYTLGEPVWVKLVEAEPLTGGLVLRLQEPGEDEVARPERPAGKPDRAPASPGRRHGPGDRRAKPGRPFKGKGKPRRG